MQFERCLADQTAEHAMEVKRRHRRLFGECIEIKRGIKPVGDGRHCPLDCTPVKISGVGSHATNLSSSKRPCLICVANLQFSKVRQ